MFFPLGMKNLLHKKLKSKKKKKNPPCVVLHSEEHSLMIFQRHETSTQTKHFPKSALAHFFSEGQRGNILGSVGGMVSVATPP